MLRIAQTNPPKLLYLESLRGIGASAVALYHFHVNSFVTDNNFVRNSWLMVELFFVLSGYVLTLNYQKKINSFKNLFEFQVRRFLRIYPLHIVMLFVYLVFELLRYFLEIKFHINSNYGAFTFNNLNSFFHNLLLTQNLFVDRLTWNYPSWSISAEFFTYIIFAAAVLASQKKIFFVIISCAISLFAFYNLLYTGMSESHGFLRCLYSFFIGSVAYNCQKFNCHGKFIGAIFLAITISMMGLFTWEKDDRFALIFPLMFGLLIFLFHHQQNESYITKFLEFKPLVYLGKISYGIYMIHAAVWWVLSQPIRFFFNVSNPGKCQYYLMFSNQFASTCVVLLGFFITLFLANLSYKYIESPINIIKPKIN